MSGTREQILHLERRRIAVRRGVGHADPQHRVPASVAQPPELHVVLARHGHDDATGGLREEGGCGIHPVSLHELAQPDARADAEAHDGLGECLGESAGGQVVRARDERLQGCRMQQFREPLLVREVDRGRTATEVPVDRAGPGGAAELGRRDAEQVDVLARILPA